VKKPHSRSALQWDGTRSSAVSDMSHECLCTSYSHHCGPLVAIYWPDFPTRRGQLIVSILAVFSNFCPIWRLQWEDPLELSGSLFGVEKTRMAGLQSGKGRTMIDLVVCAQYINLTDTQTATQPHRHSNSRPNDCIRAAKTEKKNTLAGCHLISVRRAANYSEPPAQRVPSVGEVHVLVRWLRLPTHSTHFQRRRAFL